MNSYKIGWTIYPKRDASCLVSAVVKNTKQSYHSNTFKPLHVEHNLPHIKLDLTQLLAQKDNSPRLTATII